MLTCTKLLRVQAPEDQAWKTWNLAGLRARLAGGASVRSGPYEPGSDVLIMRLYRGGMED